MAHVDARPNHCPEPALAALIEPYCFDEIADEAKERFETHLLHCGPCWRHVERLQEHVEALRTDRRLAETVMTPDVLRVLGISGALHRPLAGHRHYVVAASLLYALLFAVPVVVEVAYAFDRFGRLAVLLAPLVFMFAMTTTLWAFWVSVRRVRSGTEGFAGPLLILLGATVVLCLLLLPLLPSAPTVDANFQTYPVRLGYLKSVFYAWLAGPLLVFWPFHFVIVMQARLGKGQHARILAVLNRDKSALPPTGTPFIPVWVLGSYAVGLCAFHYLGVTHLFENLRPGPYMSLFMALVLTRVIAGVSLAVVAVIWYANSLIELKRECLAVLSLATRHDGQGRDSRLALRQPFDSTFK